MEGIKTNEIIYKNRNPLIDILKGFAILLVVIVAMLGKGEAEHNIFFRICCSFHMSLFIVIAGFNVGGK